MILKSVDVAVATAVAVGAEASAGLYVGARESSKGSSSSEVMNEIFPCLLCLVNLHAARLGR